MTSTLIDEISLVDPLEVHQTFVHLCDEAADLQVTERFLAAVERRYLHAPTDTFDQARLRSNLRILEAFSQELHNEKYARLVNEVREHIDQWIAALEQRDAGIEAYHIRRFCDDPNLHLETIVFSALTRFYRSLGSSSANQSKFDLSITRLFSRSTEPPYRRLLIEREDLSEQIAALFEGWDFDATKKKQSQHSSLVVAKLDDFRREAEALDDYQELLHSDIFDRLRTFKRKLGALYFEPEIAAAAIDCNVAVGNAFNRLIAASNDSLSSRLNEGLDIAGAFYDASPGAERHLSEILAEIRMPDDGTGTDPRESRSGASIKDLMELVCEEAEDDSASANPKGLMPETDDAVKIRESEPAAPTAQKRLEPIFFAISQPEPDLTMLRQHLSSLDGLSEIDLRDFIGRPEDPTDHLCRSVLGTILWIEELSENELNKPGEMSASLRNEIHRLLRKSEEFSGRLEFLSRENTGDSLTRLLVVSNKLLESRLKFKRGIARFTRRNLAPAVEAAVEQAEQLPAEKPAADERPTSRRGLMPSRWLLVATLLVSLASGALYYFDQQMSEFIPEPKGVEKLDVKRLPKGEHLHQAYRSNGMVLVTAKNSWAMMPQEEQKQNLKDLLEYPSETEVRTVLITDGMGRVLGDISPDGTRVLGEELDVSSDSSAVGPNKEGEHAGETAGQGT